MKQEETWSTLYLLIASGVLAVLLLGLVFMTAPMTDLLGQSTQALGSAIHGLVALLLLVVSTVNLYLAFRSFSHLPHSFANLQLGSMVSMVLTFFTILFGNWIYIAYRAKLPGSPRSFFLQEMPMVHKIFFEFKEFISLFTLPLSVVVAYILWKYGRDFASRTWIRNSVCMMIALHFFYLLLAFGLGAAITKLKSV